MKIFETQAENLEDLVAERTGMLADEKKKVETILHSMLPMYVRGHTS